MIILGFIAALLTAFVWGFASVLTKIVFSKGANPLEYNAIRAFPVFLFMLSLVIVMGYLNDFLSINLYVILILLVVTFLGIFLGDTLYFFGIRDCGVTIAVPIAYTYPFFAYVFAYFLVGETPTIWIIIAGFLISLGIYLLSKSSNNSGIADPKKFKRGILFTITSAISFGLGTTIAKIALLSTTAIVAATYRLLLLGLLLLPYLTIQHNRIKQFSKREIMFMIIVGIIGTGVGGLFYFTALEIIGVSITSTIAATSPFHSALFATIILKENITKEKAIGMILTVGGTLLILLQVFCFIP